MYAPCPRCGGRRVIKNGKMTLALAGILIGSFLVWIGLLFPPLLFGGIVFGLGCLICAPFIKDRLFCQDCHYRWRPDKVKRGTNA